MRLNSVEKKVADIAAPVIEDMGYELLYVTLKGEEGASRILQITAENPETRTLGVDECARISRSVAAVLDVEGPVKGAYRLEVSSPGIDRFLVKEKDFTDFAGNEVKIEVNPPLEGQKRFRGMLSGEKDGNILLETDQGNVAISLETVHKAKLVMTDALIKKTRVAG
jgi:ribosome maturation factor RimP